MCVGNIAKKQRKKIILKNSEDENENKKRLILTIIYQPNYSQYICRWYKQSNQNISSWYQSISVWRAIYCFASNDESVFF